MEYKLAEIDLSDGRVRERWVPPEYVKRFFGASGLAFALIAGEGAPDVDPLGGENPLMLFAGLLTATPVPTACKVSAVARSPQTGLYSESTFGGHWGRALKGTGYSGVIVRGVASEPTYLEITPDGAQIHPAGDLWGADTFETAGRLQSRCGDEAEVAAIGPAGENRVPFASVIVGGNHARAAGRTGMGAVMGAKQLKAIVVRGDRRPEVKDPDGLRRVTRGLMSELQERTELLRDFGTAGGVQTVEHSGDLPIENWREGSWKEGARRTSGQYMARSMLAGHYACFGCPIRCGKDMEVPSGEFAGTVSHGPEYETCAAFGSMICNDDPQILVQATDLANRLGLDTISAGSAIAFAMECSEKDLIEEDIRWGDGDALISLLSDIAHRRGLGELLSRGTRAAAEQLGPLAREYVVDVKGLDVAYHDPRAFTSMAVNYATANRGGCHLEGLTYFVEGGSFWGERMGMSEHWAPAGTEGKAELTAAMQNYLSVLNSLGLCKFLLRGGVGPKSVAEWLNAACGTSLDGRELMAAGARTFNLKRLVNVALGVSRADDTLPPRLLTHPRPSGGARGVLPHLGKMLAEYYEVRGWSEEGIPTEEICAGIGLDLATLSALRERSVQS